MSETKPAILIVCGPTATGKTELAIRLAMTFNGEVINADSMQVYKGLDIGTAKPTAQQRRHVRFHLVDVAEPGDVFSAGRFRDLADVAIKGIVARGRLPIAAGGTGLYLKALTQGIFEGPAADPALREKLALMEQSEPGSLWKRLCQVDPDKAGELPSTDVGRILRALEVFERTGVPLSEHQRRHAFDESPYQAFWIGLNAKRSVLYERIDQRVIEMIDAGWVQEVRSLKNRGALVGAAANALGYRTLSLHVDGGIDLDKAVQRIQSETRNFAKRQITWFKANRAVRWFQAPEEFDDAAKAAGDWLSNAAVDKGSRAKKTSGIDVG